MGQCCNQFKQTMKNHTILLIIILLFAVSALESTQISMVTCKRSSSDKTMCLECQNNYHLHEGQCYVDIPSCISYVFGNICRQCKNGLILVNNECCDRVCMSKIYNEEQHDSKVAENKEEVLRRAEVDGLQRSIAIIAKNSVKTGQNYDISSSKCQRFDKIFRYFVELVIDGKQYIAINDYNIVTGDSVFVNLSPKGEETKNQVTLTQENIHGNAIYEKGYKFIYEKFGLDLYELEFVRMTAITLGKSTELKFIFVGPKALLIQIMVNEAGQPYVLWKQQKSNVSEIKQEVDNLKKIDILSKQQNFKQVFAQVISQKNFQTKDIQILDITAISQTEYIFLIYHRIFKLRFKIEGFYTPKTGKVSIKKIEEVFSTKLQDIKVPEVMQTKVITKQMLTKSVQSKEVFDFIYKLRPTFRQNLVQNVKLLTGQDVTKILVITKKENKDYRIVVLKDIKSQQLQIIDEGYLTPEVPTATIVTINNDATKTITTNKIDTSRTEVKIVLETLTQNNIKVEPSQIQSLEYTEGPKSVEYTAVIKDNSGKPYKQVTLLQDKLTKQTTVIDETSLLQQVKITRPKAPQIKVVPISEYYKPEMKEIINKVEQKVSKQVSVTKISKIQYRTASEATKYYFTAENSKGNIVHITALQPKGETGIEIINVQPDVSATLLHSTHQIKTVKMVTETGVKLDYTNNKELISSSQNVNVAISSITSQQPDLSGYEVVCAQTKTYVQHQQQILVLTNGEKTVQVVGNIDQKTLRYVLIQRKQIPIHMTYPLVTQITVPSSIYITSVQDNPTLKYSQNVLLDKYKIFKNKIPTTTTVSTFNNVDIVTYSYEVGQKKFIAVVQYDKVIKENSKIVEVNPIDILAPVKVDQTVVEGKTITTSNNVEEIQNENSQTKTVLNKILLEYALLKKYNITQITLTQSDFSNLFEITYTNPDSKEEITVTVRTDIDGKTITIQDVSTSQLGEQVISQPNVQTIIFKPQEYTSTEVKSIVDVVNTKIKIDKIKNVVSQTHPTYVLTEMAIQSSGKPYKATVMESKGQKKVVSVSTAHQETQVVTTKQITTKLVDQNGNTVVKTTDQQYIKTLPEIVIAIQEIKSAKPQVVSWNTVAAVTVDYGTAKQISVTLQGPSPSQLIKSNLIYDQTTKSVKVISVKNVQVTTISTSSPQKVFQQITTPLYTSVVLPSIAINTQIKTDKKLETVVNQIRKLDTTYANILPATTQIQPLSDTVTQYTSVIQLNGKQQQIVMLHNSTTNSVSILSSNQVDETAKPYYIQQTTDQNGVITISNNVKQITQTRSQFSSVLQFTNKWISFKPDFSNIQKVEVHPSAASGTIIYTIETTDNVKKQSIKVVYNQKTKEMTVKDLSVAQPTVIYPKPAPKINLDISNQQAQVQKYINNIQNSQIPALQNIKEVVSVQKQRTQYYEKTYAEVKTQDKNLKVTLLNQPGEQPTVVNVQGGDQSTQKVEEVKQTDYVDNNGNKIKEISGASLITQNIATYTSLQTIVTENQVLNDYLPVSAQIIDYGTVQQVALLLSNKKTKQVIQTTTFYNISSNTATVISVRPSKLPYFGEKGVSSQQTVVSGQGEQVRPKPAYPTVVIPKIALPEVTQSDKALSAVITQIKQSSTSYTNVLPNLAEIQQLSDTTKKYTVVMETKTSKDQIVVIYDNNSKTSKTISVQPIPATVEQAYLQKHTLPTGQTVYTSNSVTTLANKFSDLKFVVEKITTTVPEVNIDQAVVRVVPKDTVNTYTIESIQNNQQILLQVNYDIVSNKTYVTNYQIAPVTVLLPAPTTLTPVVLSYKEKITYLQILKNSEFSEIKNSVNIVSSKTISYTLYNETILQVQVANKNNQYVKLIQAPIDPVPKVIDVVSKEPQTIQKGDQISAPPEEGGETGKGQLGEGTQVGESGEQTTTKNDQNGNEVTESTDKNYIQKLPISQTVLTQIAKQFPISKDYKIKYIKTVTYGNTVEVISTLSSTEANKLDLKSIIFYNKSNRAVKIISVKPIDILLETHPQTSTAVYPTVIVSQQTALNTLTQRDIGFKIVISSLQKSSEQYKTAVPISTQVQIVSENVTKYNILIDVSGRKEQKVYTFNKGTNKVELHATVVVPSVIQPLVNVEKTVNGEKVLISNQIEKIQVTYPETISVVSALKNQNPNLLIDSIVVTPQSSSSAVTLVSPSNTGKEFIINKYVYSESTATKISQQTIKIAELVVPKPIPAIKITPSVISTLPAVQKQLIKIVNVDTTQSLQIEKIQEVTVTKNANIQIYQIKTTNANNKTVKTEISYNPTTEQATLVDLAAFQAEKIVKNTSIIKETSGVTSIVTVNSATITQGKEYQQINDFMTKNHPNDNIQGSTAIISAIEKYQRSVVRTLVLQQENSTIQATYLIDQRTQSIAELFYKVIKTPLVSQQQVPVKPQSKVYTNQDVTKVISSEVSVTKTITSIYKVDSTLSTLTPTYVEVQDYDTSSVVTVVFDTPSSNSRILTIFNKTSGEAKVIDYSKIPKVIEGSKTVETINQFGQKIVFTDNASTLTTSKQFTSIISAIEELYPVIKGKTIRGVQTVTKSSGTEYKLVVVENGVISQVNVLSDINTNKITLISTTETPVSEQILSITKTKIQQQTTTLDVKNIQSSQISTIKQTVIKQIPLFFDSNSTVIAGSVKDEGLALTYELTMTSKQQITNTVKITKQKNTNKIIINDVKPIFVQETTAVPITTSLVTDIYGNIQYTTNSITEIKKSKEIQTVIKKVYDNKPQLAVLVPISTKTTTYGNQLQTTVVFGGQSQPGVQITSILNIQTQEVTIIDSKVITSDIKTIKAQPIPASEIQTIPLAVIPTAVRKFPQIKQIISAAEKTGILQSLIVENLWQIKKYIAITTTKTGKTQNIYIFTKNNRKVDLLQTVDIPSVVNNQIYTTTTNQLGQVVTTSTSVEQISSQVVEVNTAINQIKHKYNVDTNTNIKLIESKGTKVKQIKVITQMSKEDTQTIFTCLVQEEKVTIIDVQAQKTPAIIPIVISKTTSETVINTEQTKVVSDVVFNNPTVKQYISQGSIKTIKGSSNAFSTNYEVVIENKKGQTAILNLLQTDDKPLSVVNVITEGITSTVSKEVTTITTVNSITGNKVTITNDPKVIVAETAINQITQNIISKLPELTNYIISQLTTTKYNQVSQNQLVFTSEGKPQVKVITLRDSTTNQVRIINSQTITQKTTQSVTIQTIPAIAINLATKKWPEVSTIITNIQSTISTATVETLIVKDIPQFKIYTPIVTVPEIQDSKTEYVFVFNKTSHQIKQIDKLMIPAEIKPIKIEKKTDQFGQTVIKGNDITVISQQKPDLPIVINQIKNIYGESATQTIKSIELTEQAYSTQYKLVTEINDKLWQVVVIKQNNDIKVLGLDLIPQTTTLSPGEGSPSGQNGGQSGLGQTTQTGQNGQTGQSAPSETVPIDSEVGTQLVETIKTSGIESIKNAEITLIKSTETFLNTIYTVTTKNSLNHIQHLTISVSPDQRPLIVQVIDQKQPTKTILKTQSQTIKQASVVTGQTVIITNQKQEIAQYANILNPSVIKVVPQVINYQPSSVKTTKIGQLTWTTLVYTSQMKQTETQKVVQVTTVVNSTDSTVTVIQSKPLVISPGISTILPQTNIYIIPQVAINTAIKRLPQVSQVITQITKNYKRQQIESIEIEVFGQIQKITTVIKTGTDKTIISYTHNKSTGQTKFIETSKAPLKVEPLVFKQETNQYGETTTITNKVTQITTAIPEIQSGIKYIWSKYPVTNTPTPSSIKVVEYPKQYTLTLTNQIQSANQLSVVVSIDKTTEQVTLISTYTQNDIIKPKVIAQQQPSKQTASSVVQIQTEFIATSATEVTNLVKYIQNKATVPVNSIKTVLSAEKTTTLFGTEIITIQAITEKNTKVKTVVNYNPKTEEYNLNDFVVIEQPQAPTNINTEFSVDLVTGAKLTVTNNPTVIASSSILNTISQKVTTTQGFSNSIMTESSSTEYPNKVKVVCIFTDQTNNQATQFVSIFDKTTSEVQIIQTRNTSTTTTQIKKEVFTSGQIASAKNNKPQIKKIIELIRKENPKYTGQQPETIVFQSLKDVDIVSAIYQTSSTVKTQVLTIFDKRTQTLTILQSNTIQPNIKPFFYQQKQNQQGQQIILSNSITEVKQRVQTASTLNEYIINNTQIAPQKIQTVQLVVTPSHHQYTLLVQTNQGIAQHEFLLNVQTKTVKQINKQVITSDIPVVSPKKQVVITLAPDSKEVQPIVDVIIHNPEISLNNVDQIISIKKQDSSKIPKYQIEYATSNNTLNKLVVVSSKIDNKVTVVDERPLLIDFIKKQPIVVKESIDDVSKSVVTVYPSVEIFKIDTDSSEIITYLQKAVPQSTKYVIESARKEKIGNIVQYDILLKANSTAPLQITLAKDNINKNIIVLQNRTITEKLEKSVIQSSVQVPVKLQVSDIEKENIKVLSKLGLVKDIKEYTEVKVEQVSSNDQFMQAINSVKTAYSTILNNAVIIKTLEKKSLQNDSFKVFFKAKDQIYEASLQLNTINGQTKLTEFIKIGTQSYPKSEVNVYSDLCYGYQPIEDLSIDSNLDFISNHLKQKHDALKDSSLIEAQQITLSNGRTNYKLYFKKDSTTLKYIVYYEPEYKRILEVKGSSFSIGDQYKFVAREQQINDPYFRKLDTYVRQNNELLGSASILHTQAKDDGQTIQFRTVYSSQGKTFHQIASINKDNQNINQGTLSEIIQIPLPTKSSSTSECNYQQTKLDIHDLGKNGYFTQCYKYIQSKYSEQLISAQLLGAGEQSNFNTFTYLFYFIIDENKITTLTVDFNPLSQQITVLAQPQTISLQDGYYPIRSDKRLTTVRNWLKENNPDLSNSVLVASLAKKFYFGTLYKIVFKVSTKYLAYVVYMDCGTKEMKIYDTQQLDNYYNNARNEAGGQDMIVGSQQQGTFEGDLQVGEGQTILQSKLKGFARPKTSSS